MYRDILPGRFSCHLEYGNALAAFLSKYSLLFDFDARSASPVDQKPVHILIDNGWEARVPKEWRSFFEGLRSATPTHNDFTLGLLALQRGDVDSLNKVHPVPESLVQYMNEAKSLLPAEIACDNVEVHALNVQQSSATATTTSTSTTEPTVSTSSSVDQPPQPASGTRKGKGRGSALPIKEGQNSPAFGSLGLMSFKKRHEVERLGGLIVSVIKQTNANVVIDFGAGKGYLTGYITLNCPDVIAVGVEAGDAQTEGFRTRATKMESKLRNHDPHNAFSSSRLIIIQDYLPLTIEPNQFTEIVKRHLPHITEVRSILVGLHSCGDLSPTILKLFLNTNAVATVSVGCCYHLLSEGRGTPLSKFFTLGPTKLDFHLCTGRHIAANPVPQHQTASELQQMVRSQSFRAGLESFLYMLIGGHPETHRPMVHFLGKTPEKLLYNFDLYAEHSLKRLLRPATKNESWPEAYRVQLTTKVTGLLSTPRPELLAQLRDFYQTLSPTTSQTLFHVECFAALRHLIGPLLEALILVDRALYLNENCSTGPTPLTQPAQLLQLFSPSVSPRRIALVATKQPPPSSPEEEQPDEHHS
ncbi:C6 transcription factor [Pelomyxa schiedti]|nr:C6 transcription factor [Pelomyxa schiedti]